MSVINEDVLFILNEQYEKLSEYCKLLEEKLDSMGVKDYKDYMNKAEEIILEKKKEKGEKQSLRNLAYKTIDDNDIDRSYEEIIFYGKKVFNDKWNGFYNDLVSYMLDELSMSKAVIKCIFNYCIELEKTSIAYIKSIALDWNKKGIKTEEDAISHIDKYKKDKLEKRDMKSNYKNNKIQKLDTEEILKNVNEISLENYKEKLGLDNGV